MALIAAFIGIDRYSDPEIRELTGAGRDAKALWALFSDTLPEIKAQLLVDNEATIQNVRAALDKTLGKAGKGDTVVLSLSCHGTRDHRIAVHDTRLENLPGTTIPMQELAERFKQSQAKAVLCILDCCFSGGAPARVLDDSPAPREPIAPLEEFAGEGRILLAASNVNEPALELPRERHGLLTKAVLEVLETTEASVSLAAASDRIMERVRVTASRMGYTQTPVFLGHIAGGLVLPGLKRGSRFQAAFPELGGIRVAGKIDELAAFGLSKTILEAWKRQFSGADLNKLQLDAVNDYRVLDGESLLVIAPTTSGKTFIGEMAAARALLDGRKSVFLFPYKALVNEKYDQFKNVYEEGAGMRVIRCSGDYQDQTTSFFRGKYDLALLTYETFLSLALTNPALLNQVGLVVVDEAQFITDPNRGIVVELLLTYLLTAKERGVSPQLITLSAVIGAVNEFDNWLSIKKLVTTDRPVPLVEGVLDRTGQYQVLNAQGRAELTQLVPRHMIVQRRDKPSAQDVIVPLVAQLLRTNADERIIIFRNRRGPAQGCASYLAKDLGRESADGVIESLPKADPSTSSASLQECLRGGTAFHTSDLSREERVMIEREYRNRQGKIAVLGATTTVAAGINTPASTVILAEQEFMGEDGRPFTIAEYKNMAGRAGRLGFKEEGKSIILAETSGDREALFRKYVLGKPEALRSSFDHRDLDTWLLRLLAQVRKVAKTDVTRLLVNTYGGYLAVMSNAKWPGEVEASIADRLRQMLELGLLEEESGFVQLTLLGQACGRSSLSFSSAMRLVRMLKAWQGPLSAENLMVLVQGLDESDAIYTPVMKKGEREARWTREAAQRFGNRLVQMLQQFVADHWGWVARCKRAYILSAYIGGARMQDIERTATINPYQGRIGAGNVRQFADAARFHMSSAWKIAAILLLDNAPTEQAIDTLLRQLEVGIPAEALGLLALPIELTRGEYLSLHSTGAKTVADVWELAPDRLQSLLPGTSAAALEGHRPKEAQIE